MKKTLISVAAASLMMGTIATADVDFDVSGQAVIYYQTAEGEASTAADLFDRDASYANVGIQLNANADLGNGFGFGSQVSILDTWGLENNLVAAAHVMQYNSNLTGATNTGAVTTDPQFTKMYLTKTIGNTTLKAGRQELPKSLSPLAFSEGWNVFKNTFDAILAINSDLPDTTVVGAYVSTSNASNGDLSVFGNMSANTNVAGVGATVDKGAYMLTVQNKSIPMATLTGSYYHLSDVCSTGLTGLTESADAIWLDAKIAGKDLPAGLNFGLQAGQISVDATAAMPTTIETDTTAFGAKVGAKIEQFTVSAAYTSVDEGLVSVQNVGTGVKTPLYTQMVGNQGWISNDADTILLKGVASFGDAGKLIVGYGMTTDSNTGGTAATENDKNELDVIYKVKAGGVQYLAAYVMQDQDAVDEDKDIVRVWARYAF